MGKADNDLPRGRLPRVVLRRLDQAVVASLTAAGLLSLGVYWVVQGGLQHRLIDVEHEQPRTAHYRVDLNHCQWPELAQMPGIGETLAKRIVESRRTQGPFKDQDDLDRVRGIGPRTLERIKPYLLPIAPQRAVAGP